MAARRAVRLAAAGTVACGICGYFATRARGSENVPANTLLSARINDKSWARTFWLSVPSLKALKVGPELAERPDGTNAIQVNQPAVFRKFLIGALNGEAFQERCKRVASLAPPPPSEDQAAVAAPGQQLALPMDVALPKVAQGQLRVVGSSDTELLLREVGSPVLMWFGLEEKKPQWVGDSHMLEFYYGTLLDTSECKFTDYLVYLVDVWQGRRIVNEGAQKALTRKLLPPKSTTPAQSAK